MRADPRATPICAATPASSQRGREEWISSIFSQGPRRAGHPGAAARQKAGPATGPLFPNWDAARTGVRSANMRPSSRPEGRRPNDVVKRPPTASRSSTPNRSASTRPRTPVDRDLPLDLDPDGSRDRSRHSALVSRGKGSCCQALPPPPPQSGDRHHRTGAAGSQGRARLHGRDGSAGDRIEQSPSQQLDQLLKEVPGLQLFRRSDARSGHPTSQGVTLRALGGNASSRALLMLDGVPQSDPFGGWVNWPAYDPGGLGEVRVVRGGGSVANGPGALAGTIEHDQPRRRGAWPASSTSAAATRSTASGAARRRRSAAGCSACPAAASAATASSR